MKKKLACFLGGAALIAVTAMFLLHIWHLPSEFVKLEEALHGKGYADGILYVLLLLGILLPVLPFIEKREVKSR